MTNFPEQLPPLRPPRAPLPPGFWETDAPWWIAFGLVAFSLLLLLISRALRRSAPAPDPAAIAVRELGALVDAPDTPDTAGRVATALRAWLAARHDPAHPGRTSAEWVDLLRARSLPEPAVQGLSELLAACDHARYTGVTGSNAPAARALELLPRLEPGGDAS